MRVTNSSDKSISFVQHIFSKATRKVRLNQLKEAGISEEFSSTFADFEKDRYSRAMFLIQQGIGEIYIEDLTKLKEEKYQQALKLAEMGITDSFLFSLSELEKHHFEKAVRYLDYGFDDDCAKLYAELSEDKEKEAIQLIREGFTPLSAVHLSKLSQEERKIALEFLFLGAEIEDACEIAKLDKDKQAECRKLIEQGISAPFVEEIADLNEEAKKRVPELLELKVGGINIADFANMTEPNYARTMELLSLDVNPDYILDILEIENGEAENDEYEKYREKGYSYTSSFALSLLRNKEIKMLEELIEKHPDIKELFFDEYDIKLVELQNNDDKDVILTKRMRTDDGTIIKLVQTFDTYGDKTRSRTEEFMDNSTSSVMQTKSSVFRIKYDKFGEVREMLELIQSPDTKETTGVIHTVASTLLKGAFEAVYYNIDDFKSEGAYLVSEHNNIKECTNTAGETISSVIQNEDGSITYLEDYGFNNFAIKREYTEKRDENGNLTYSSYTYRIDDEETKANIMDIHREFKRNNDGSTTNIINANEYNLSYNDSSKTVQITDGERNKTLNFKDILPKYSEEVIWGNIKQLPVDTLLTIHKNITKWHYCAEEDSAVSEFKRSLSSGRNLDIIEHETGHIKSHEDKSICENNDLCQIYGTEMDTFLKNVPYNEQEFLQYFSPRADLDDSDGINEFIAETNLILNSYGTRHCKLNTRTFLLNRYFPQSIAKVAELTGKNSRKSLLE